MTKAALKKITVVALDVDGVLTDGRIIYDSTGRETKVFDVQDGLAIVLMRRLGFKLAIISARASKTITVRAKDLGIDRVYMDAYPKRKAYEAMLKAFKVRDENVCFVGDDLVDIPLLKRAGFAVAVRNACPEARRAADYVTRKTGGRGAVREVIELILKSQGRWAEILRAHC